MTAETASVAVEGISRSLVRNRCSEPEALRGILCSASPQKQKLREEHERCKALATEKALVSAENSKLHSKIQDGELWIPSRRWYSKLYPKLYPKP